MKRVRSPNQGLPSNTNTSIDSPELSKRGFTHNTSDGFTPTTSSEDPAHTHIRPAAHWALLTDGAQLGVRKPQSADGLQEAVDHMKAPTPE